MTQQELPQKLDLKSMDIAQNRIDELRAIFPEVVTEGKIDFDALKRALGEWVEPNRERFGLNWIGKADCMKVIQQPSIGTLNPDLDESVDFENTNNIFIEGDNLEVLKLLQKSYFGKIKMIYIDPPYNTLGDFIYPDNYSESLSTYLEYSNQVDSTGKRFSTNSDSDGRLHTKWLNMMYPRLYLAKNLLKKDGVFVSHIDENEITNYLLILDEIFGAENNLGTIIWDKKNPKGDAKKIAIQNEYLVIYAKDADELKLTNKLQRPKVNAKKMLAKASSLYKRIGLQLIPKKLEDCIKEFNLDIIDEQYKSEISIEDVNEDYQNWLKKQNVSGGEAAYKFIDENGDVFRTVSMAWPNKDEAPEEYFIPLIHPITKRPCPVPDRGWRNPPATMDELLKSGLIIFGDDEEKQPERKYLLKENMYEKIPSVISFGGSDDALLKELKIPFDNPKPVELSSQLISYFANDNGDIVLDFFAGSGTTADATMRLNSSQNKVLNYILVQLPEVLDSKNSKQKASYKFCLKNKIKPVISYITKARIKASINRLKASIGKSSDLFEGSIDLGFKAFKLTNSNFKVWDGNIDNDEAIVKQLELNVYNINDDSNDLDFVFEILLKSGFSLDTKIENIKNLGEHVYGIANNELIICLEKEITKQMIDAIADYDPIQVICLDAGFNGNDQLKTNAVQTFKSKAKIDFKTV